MARSSRGKWFHSSAYEFLSSVSSRTFMRGLKVSITSRPSSNYKLYGRRSGYTLVDDSQYNPALSVGRDSDKHQDTYQLVARSPPSEESSEFEELEEPSIDLIHKGLVFPTPEECRRLRRISDTIPWNAYLIAVVELAERFSYYGSSVVFTNFLQQPLPPGSITGAGFANGQSGALGLGQRTSTAVTTFYVFWCYLTPLYGAYVADTYWGRFKTVCISIGVALIGHIILIITAVPGVIESPDTALVIFVIALVIMGIGTGGFKSNISPLVAEQYKRTKLFVKVTASGERVIVDPALTTSRIYMYFYLFINIGAIIGQIGMTYTEKFVGFWLAYTLPTVVFLLCPIVLWAGRNSYQRSPPTGSVLSAAFRLWYYAARGKWSLNPIKTLNNFNAGGFWESAKPSHISLERRPAWMTFDDAWVDEVSRGFNACRVFIWYPIYWLGCNQITNNLVSQAATMTTHGLPNDVLSNIDPIALIVFIPLFDILVYPLLRRLGLNFSALKRITAGFLAAAAGMVWAAIVQAKIYETSPCGDHASGCRDAVGNALVSPLSVWTQTGAFTLLALSEILASITGLEYAYTKAPKNMRSLVMALFLFTSAIASALQEVFVTLSADPLLVWNYGIMALVISAAGCLFWWSVKDLDAAEDRLNNLNEGHVKSSDVW